MRPQASWELTPRPQATCDPALLGALPDFRLRRARPLTSCRQGQGLQVPQAYLLLGGSPELRSQKPRPWALPLPHWGLGQPPSLSEPAGQSFPKPCLLSFPAEGQAQVQIRSRGGGEGRSNPATGLWSIPEGESPGRRCSPEGRPLGTKGRKGAGARAPSPAAQPPPQPPLFPEECLLQLKVGLASQPQMLPRPQGLHPTGFRLPFPRPSSQALPHLLLPGSLPRSGSCSRQLDRVAELP